MENPHAKLETAAAGFSTNRPSRLTITEAKMASPRAAGRSTRESE